MHCQLRSLLVAFMLLACGLFSGLSTDAFAESTIETLSAPAVEPNEAYAHGDGSVTITNNNCSTYGEESENGAVTISSGGSVLSEIPRVEGLWDTITCANYMVPGFDSTTYVVQKGPAPNYLQRVVAFRNGAKLWRGLFPDPSPGCNERSADVQSMAMGQDGSLYAAIYWPYKSEACPEKDGMASLNLATGGNRFPIQELPFTGSSSRGSSISEIMPYENGEAILNGNEALFYNDEGKEESSKRFQVASSEETILEIKIVPKTGRIYWFSQKYNTGTGKWEKSLYYHDLEGSSNEKIELSGEEQLVGIAITPYNGVVAQWKEGATKGFTYIDEEGTEDYQEILSTETGAEVQEAGLTHWIMVDDLGNVIVRRILDQNSGDHDRNVVVDSFSPAGIETRLFSTAPLGTNGVVDSFTSTSPLTQSMGEGKVYLTLCHVEGKITEGCDSTKHPEVISISDSSIGEYDYPRSAIFNAGLKSSSYVALGDSYSSGEGVPLFISPSDEDGCHRSYHAYPVDLTEMNPSLRLDAFAACSGAKANDVEEGMDGELSQLDSLDENTEIVTITIGGNDAKFADFALECVNPLGSCDSSSSQYEESMEEIEVLPEKLEELYSEIRLRAKDAEVYAIGYPQVAPEPGISCTFLSDSEKQAAREIVTELDKSIKTAVENSGVGFIYVDPEHAGSPFIGHELCQEESYFNGAEFPEKEYSFHPNVVGQYAFAVLISEAL